MRYRLAGFSRRTGRSSLTCGVALALGAFELAACNSKPAGTEVAYPAATTPAGPDAGGRQLAGPTAAPAADTVASATASDAVAGSKGNTTLQPFRSRRLVAPGLLVDIASLPLGQPVVVADSSDLRLLFTVRYRQMVIFQDTTADGLTYSDFSMPQSSRLYPLWIPAGPKSGELLVAFNNRPNKELARRFTIHNGLVVKIDTLLTFDGPAKDVDGDGKLEFSGAYDYSQETGDGQGHMRKTYDPILYYEQRPTGLVLDSALTIRRGIARFGKFYGFDSSEEILVPLER